MSNLFRESISNPSNLLPCDGEVKYFGPIFSLPESQQNFSTLKETIDWKRDSLIMYGRRITTRRKVAWYGDKPFEYTYSNVKKKAKAWTLDLIQMKAQVENKLDLRFNSCLLNYYHDGSEGMTWHCDDEKDLVKNGAIASLSLGAERKFVLRHKLTKEKISVLLEHGSLLLMAGTTQSHWQHALPITKKVLGPRINLTFRSIRETIA